MRTKKYHTVVNMLLSQQDMLLEYEELEETKGVIRIHISKNRQHNAQTEQVQKHK